MIDSHAHLYFDRFDEDRQAVIDRAHEAGVDRIINIGIDVPTSRASVDLAIAQRGFFASVGLHPTSTITDLDADLRSIRELALAHPEQVVAIGEFGLDYYWDTVPPDEQRPRLESQLDLALELDLPVIFHCRDALDDLLECLEARPRQSPGVFHCFGGGPADAERALALGYHVSFAGNVSYPKAHGLHEAAARIPLDRLLLETDAPFLAPQPRRGKRNEPGFVVFTCAALAEIHGISPEALAAAATHNTERLFSLTDREAAAK